MEILGETDQLMRSTLAEVLIENGIPGKEALARADYIYATFDGLRMYSVLSSQSRQKKKILRLFENTLHALFESG